VFSENSFVYIRHENFLFVQFEFFKCFFGLILIFFCNKINEVVVGLDNLVFSSLPDIKVVKIQFAVIRKFKWDNKYFVGENASNGEFSRTERHH
jgi:hypothetical protein